MLPLSSIRKVESVDKLENQFKRSAITYFRCQQPAQETNLKKVLLYFNGLLVLKMYFLVFINYLWLFCAGRLIIEGQLMCL